MFSNGRVVSSDLAILRVAKLRWSTRNKTLNIAVDLLIVRISLLLLSWRLVLKFYPLLQVWDIAFSDYELFAPDGPFKFLGAEIASEAGHQRVTEQTLLWQHGTNLSNKLVPYWAPILRFYLISLAVIDPVRVFINNRS